MTKVYAKNNRPTYSFLFSLAGLFLVLLSLGGCAGGMGGSYDGWRDTQAVVTRDPQALPDIAWQTPGQRRVLTRQDEIFAQEQTRAEGGMTAMPDRPGLQNMTAGAALPRRKVTAALLVPLTGQHAALGQSMLKAAQMALFDVGSANFELVPRDTASTPEGAAAAARSAAAERADLILGPIFADDLRMVRPVAQTAGIPVISFTTDWTLAGNNTYIMGFLPHAQVARVMEHARSQGIARVAAFGPQTEYCDVVLGALRRTGADIVRTGRYAPNQPDLNAQVEMFVNSTKTVNAEGLETLTYGGLVLPVGGESLRALVSVFDLYGVNAQNARLIGTGLWDDETLARNPSLYGGWYAAPDPKLLRDFEKRFEESFGARPPRIASLAYDATALSAVLSRNPGNPYAPGQLTNPRGFAGIDGLFRFRNDGLAERGLAVLEIQSGGARVVSPAPTAFVTPGT